MISRLSSHLAISMFFPKPTGLADSYGRLHIIKKGVLMFSSLEKMG